MTTDAEDYEADYPTAYTDRLGDYPPMPRNYSAHFVEESKSAQAKLAAIEAAIRRVPGRHYIGTDELQNILMDTEHGHRTTGSRRCC